MMNEVNDSRRRMTRAATEDLPILGEMFQVFCNLVVMWLPALLQ